MKRRLIEVIKGEQGQVLPIVLVLMLIGGLLIAPSLSYAATSLKAGQIFEKKVNGLYAADAGIEDALWRLKKGLPASYPYSYQLPEPVNQMQVDILPDEIGTYTLYFGKIEETNPSGHYVWLAVDGEMGKWEEEEGAYPYTITVTRQPEADGNIFLGEIGVRLPVGYEYKPGSAASFFEDELFSTDEPVDDPIEQDQAGAYMPRWRFQMGGQDKPEVTEYPAIQTFYVTDVTGEGALEGDYAWVEALSGDIDVVGEVVGKLYRITATATQDDKTTATVAADVMLNEGTGEIRVILWQVNPPEE